MIDPTAQKVSKYGVISGPHLLAFGVNTERYFVSLRIQPESGKIRTRNNSGFGHFPHNLLVGTTVLTSWFNSYTSGYVET